MSRSHVFGEITMSTAVAELKDSILGLPQEERNELLNWVADEFEVEEDPEFMAMLERRHEELVTGKVVGLSREEFFKALDADRTALG